MGKPRPFYHRFAWAYDLLVSNPIDARVTAMVSLLGKRGVRPCDDVVDAGCGTGRYARELADRGFRVFGFDSSPEMVEVARERTAAVAANLEFSAGDLTSFNHARQFRAILCRGVLNDLLTDNDRQEVARQFAKLLAPGGVLLLDVRDWLRTVDRYRARPRATQAIDLADGGRLTFQSETTLDPSTRQMMISETFQFRGGGSSTVECYSSEFRMRCWSALELHVVFSPWFENIDILPDYVVPPAWTDRLVLVGTHRGGKRPLWPIAAYP
jgi:SAM-dependent methyltransferase